MTLPQFDDLPFNARPDLTPYLIHLTKNTRVDDEFSALANLKSILKAGEIWGSNTSKGFIKGPNTAVCFMDVPFQAVHRQYPSAAIMGKAGNGNTFELHSSFGILTSGMALVSSSILVCADSASNSAICRRISAISRSRDSRDLNSGRDQVPAQIKGVCNRLQHGWTMTPAKSPGVHSDGEAHRPVGGEQFVPTGLVEFHAISARPYLRISAFGIHDNSESNS